MIKGFLPPLTRKKLEKLLRETRDVKVARRLDALLRLNEGRTIEEVADWFRCNARTIKRWYKLYCKEGLDGLCRLKHKGDPGKLNPEQIRQFQAALKQGLFRSVKQACAWVWDNFQVRYTPGGMKSLLHRVGASYHKVKGFLWKADVDEQKEFVKRYHGQRAAARRAGAKKTRFYFVDACHPVWGLNHVYSCWLMKGQQFLVGMGSGRKRLNILGAYSPDDQEYIDIRTSEENISGPQTIRLFEKIGELRPEADVIYIYLDNARYYKSPAVREWLANHPNFRLEFLPTYSPNLNLIERLWKFLKNKALRQFHESFESMTTAVANVLENLSRYKEELKTLMVEKFHIIEDIPKEYRKTA